MKKSLLNKGVAKFVLVLGIFIFVSGVVSITNVSAASSCRPGQVNSYSAKTGELCPIVTLSAEAQANQNLAQCAPGDSYSEVTGEKCGPTTPGQVLGASVSVDDCQSGDLFSAKTGERCITVNVQSASGSMHLNMTLKIGSYNGEVKVLQNKLITLGYLSGRADGHFGPKTKEAVIKFQTNNNLTADGVVGSRTRAALNQ